MGWTDSDLAKNGASIPSKLGGARPGYLRIVLSAPIHASIAGTIPFILPQQLVPLPAIPNTATAAKITERMRLHGIRNTEGRKYNNIYDALKKQLLSAIDNIYFLSLRQLHVGSCNLLLWQLLYHIMSSYGSTTTAIDLRKNDDTMKWPWGPSTPFEHIIAQIANAIEYAEDGKKNISLQQIVNKAHTLVYSTGMFFENYETWDEKPGKDKIWPIFKTHFLAATKKVNLCRQTAQQAGFHGAHYVQEDTMEPPTNGAMEALANLAQASINDRNTITTIQTTIASLTTQLQYKDEQLHSSDFTFRTLYF
jgi:hypothetical protein